jgi:predicted kinase
MPKVIAIVGLPGSGKSFLGKQIAREQNCLFVDDINVRTLPLVEENKGNIVITDVWFCEEKTRTRAAKMLNEIGYDEIEWIFFENAPDKCRKNVQRRADGRAVMGLIQGLTGKYTIPQEVEVRKING